MNLLRLQCDIVSLFILLDLLFLVVSLCRFPFLLHVCLVLVALVIIQSVVYSELFLDFFYCHILGLLAHITILYMYIFFFR